MTPYTCSNACGGVSNGAYQVGERNTSVGLRALGEQRQTETSQRQLLRLFRVGTDDRPDYSEIVPHTRLSSALFVSHQLASQRQSPRLLSETVVHTDRN